MYEKSGESLNERERYRECNMDEMEKHLRAVIAEQVKKQEGQSRETKNLAFVYYLVLIGILVYCQLVGTAMSLVMFALRMAGHTEIAIWRIVAPSLVIPLVIIGFEILLTILVGGKKAPDDKITKSSKNG